MSCFVMFRHAGAASAGLCGQGSRGGRQPCGRFRRRGGTGVPVLRAFRVCGRAGVRGRARFAAARFVRVIARARRREGMAGRGPLRKRHEMSCDVMGARGGLRLAAGFAAGARRGRLRSFVPPSRQRAGRGVPVSRAIARAGVRGRGRAYRGGAVRARDCPRETAGAPRPSVPAGVFFAAPSQSLSAEKPKGGPGSRLSLLSFYTISPNVKLTREQKGEW